MLLHSLHCATYCINQLRAGKSQDGIETNRTTYTDHKVASIILVGQVERVLHIKDCVAHLPSMGKCKSNPTTLSNVAVRRLRWAAGYTEPKWGSQQLDLVSFSKERYAGAKAIVSCWNGYLPFPQWLHSHSENSQSPQNLLWPKSDYIPFQTGHGPSERSREESITAWKVWQKEERQQNKTQEGETCVPGGF